MDGLGLWDQVLKTASEKDVYCVVPQSRADPYVAYKDFLFQACPPTCLLKL
jgi:hypothetical protein